MHQTLVEILSQTPVITDGAWGTQFQGLGLPSGDCPDEWNLSHPDRVRQVALAYVEAGSKVILTNTFRSNRISLAGFGLAGKVEEINRAGVRISKEASGNRAKVFASIGPTGKLLMMGEISEEEMASAYAEQAQALAAGGADALVIETMSDVAEAVLAIKAATPTGLPVVASLVYDSGKDKDRTMMGLTPEAVAEELTEAGADVIGANCGLGMEGYVAVARRLRAATEKPIWIKPNAGLPEMVEGQVRYKTTPEQFAREALPLRDMGISFIGGCCGTTPDFIKVLSRTLRQ